MLQQAIPQETQNEAAIIEPPIFPKSFLVELTEKGRDRLIEWFDQTNAPEPVRRLFDNVEFLTVLTNQEPGDFWRGPVGWNEEVQAVTSDILWIMETL